MTGLRAALAEMSPREALAVALRAPSLLTGAKSFRDNPAIGSRPLNGLGLHVWRIALADRMAEGRRRRLSHLIPAEERAAFDRDGFLVRRDALPRPLFERLAAFAEREAVEAREMRQGDAVTRFVDLAGETVRRVPGLAEALAPSGPIQRPLRYAAAAAGDPIIYLHTVITACAGGPADPQTAFHSDTFHATAKAWLFLRDVAPEDGPFSYVPSSHRLTPARIAWEREQSLAAARSSDPLHARGSFRADAAALAAMGYPPAVSFPVPANTLVVADTHGFHARAPSLRPSVRVALYASLRRNPFLPWTGLDPFDLPGLRGRKAAMFGLWLDLHERWLGARNPQPSVGRVRAADPAPRV